MLITVIWVLLTLVKIITIFEAYIRLKMNLLREKKAQLVILETVIYYQLYLNQLHLVFGP